MTTRRPLELFPPGDFIRRELEARDWGQQDLADIMGCSLRLVNEVVTGKRAITPETAKLLGGALGTSPQLWMNLESAHQLDKVEREVAPIERRAKLYAIAPVNEMIRRRWIERSPDYGVLERRVLNFMALPNVDDEPQPLAHAARMSANYGEETPSRRAWLCRARQLAPAVAANSFSQASLKNALQRLKLLMHEPEEIRNVPEILAEAGVRMLIVEHLSGTKIDGATFWLDRKSPVIVLSLRFGRIDSVWFTLAHELGHVEEGHGQTILEVELVGDGANPEDKPESEREVDARAADYLISTAKLESFIRRTRPLYSKKSIRAFAHTNGVHPGLVVGQLQRRGEITYSQNREMLTSVRAEVVQSALTDGWGQRVSIGLDE